ncbi:tRNA/rRNA methyltransferase YsgA [Gottschalkia purinilytica]|uniref:tRNA/rRNA methyltransferase YsgA n=1 Tax=Gottschalkia purinilytica TaxID=1503 RepID=A0A0L0W7H0_GOTPU|nr:RNA methyltransferase [Gottschalkia purinilytica]KNF07488.1 tRNA/rRNA methyltransferase YsgA [Gottschalkia purinilytica]
MSLQITSSSNHIIKTLKLLHKKRGRQKEKSFFIEGIRSVEQSIVSNADIKYIVYSDMLFDTKGGKELLEKIQTLGYDIYYITDKLFREISDTEHPQGILSVLSFKFYKLEEVLLKEKNFLVLLDRVQDPGNMGTIIRTCDAFGANGIIVSNGCVDIYNPKTVRSTMGSIFQVPIIEYEDIKDAIYDLKSKNIDIISTTLQSSDYCYNTDFNKNFALVIGNEASGISDFIVEASSSLVKIPMLGNAESLNAAIASAIIMYEVVRQRQNIVNGK